MLGIKLAAMKQQWRSIGAVVTALDFTNKNNVVALFVAAAVEAFKGCRRTIEQRQAAGTVGVCDATPALFTLAGKTLCQLLLVCGQNIDDVVRAC